MSSSDIPSYTNYQEQVPQIDQHYWGYPANSFLGQVLNLNTGGFNIWNTSNPRPDTLPSHDNGKTGWSMSKGLFEYWNGSRWVELRSNMSIYSEEISNIVWGLQWNSLPLWLIREIKEIMDSYEPPWYDPLWRQTSGTNYSVISSPIARIQAVDMRGTDVFVDQPLDGATRGSQVVNVDFLNRRMLWYIHPNNNAQVIPVDAIDVVDLRGRDNNNRALTRTPSSSNPLDIVNVQYVTNAINTAIEEAISGITLPNTYWTKRSNNLVPINGESIIDLRGYNYSDIEDHARAFAGTATGDHGYEIVNVNYLNRRVAWEIITGGSYDQVTKPKDRIDAVDMRGTDVFVDQPVDGTNIGSQVVNVNYLNNALSSIDIPDSSRWRVQGNNLVPISGDNVVDLRGPNFTNPELHIRSFAGNPTGDHAYEIVNVGFLEEFFFQNCANGCEITGTFVIETATVNAMTVNVRLKITAIDPEESEVCFVASSQESQAYHWRDQYALERTGGSSGIAHSRTQKAEGDGFTNNEAGHVFRPKVNDLIYLSFSSRGIHFGNIPNWSYWQNGQRIYIHMCKNPSVSMMTGGSHLYFTQILRSRIVPNITAIAPATSSPTPTPSPSPRPTPTPTPSPTPTPCAVSGLLSTGASASSPQRLNTWQNIGHFNILKPSSGSCTIYSHVWVVRSSGSGTISGKLKTYIDGGAVLWTNNFSFNVPANGQGGQTSVGFTSTNIIIGWLRHDIQITGGSGSGVIYVRASRMAVDSDTIHTWSGSQLNDSGNMAQIQSNFNLS